ncbi:bifunctional tRNA (5-methylaminomethyl-2-thiouridine)(34)-methyltransferase MnmD/FAD-dependent 5-carboxymethylaminomethyl-2-thiouridine(34) oxidoreductase MnmC [Zooshikella marina]|uniref:bifunctional tRNA (5-methylaminomethyl-2-thiouridine)(34)-methyltransferase MnmD/FAD-dependent 5-carboxymethylaminomethyl-2-thiouridine(34) oxidoreductase MnmC n=1 Tax=Zooshikella ganghwensis TaxID=202772 RepID=UPI001BAF14AD|nr:bifunctional tRNA (5-methylaminomethyl-2-thiouridine)(34)-methyltransferase MnmD/FAD-dependent 5-carboxymethylaminomethyl-2-thiouridine(34) oxidoreductase MnmC [Zooshikella ganghwensis]MBU2707055.1 bifunctional tRNA (5-methylaminomethyl-2-thiouridine)(34)-methyltransferase MnmD/FAD-dependent 5-carboxymethylaminomethyl-2-thiouridine(34) oxidoreductase MnmC [Zooshikella ganghwensis]
MNTEHPSQKTLPANILWDENGQPVSAEFDDVYFSRQSGLAETRYVFLQHNQLHTRWQQLDTHQQFIIAETGFGTGLNFLCAWQQWLEACKPTQSLSFISVEKYPLTKNDLEKALKLWPELDPLCEQLLAQYPSFFTEGMHRFYFAHGNVQLTLLIGDALEQLPHLAQQRRQAALNNWAIDAWFLDGFAPAKNPKMWQPELFSTMACLSKPGTTFSTFTAAGIVKRGLQAAGFSIEKVQGFGHKRDMLIGHLTSNPSIAKTIPWWHPPQPNGYALNKKSNDSTNTTLNKEAIIIGAGLAGASAAFSLAQRGWHVKVLDQHSGPAQAASGNRQGMLYAKLSPHQTPLSQLILAGYQYTTRLLPQLLPSETHQGKSWNNCGLIQLAFNEQEAKRQAALISSQLFPEQLFEYQTTEQLTERAGSNIQYPGLWWPTSGWVWPQALCQAMLAHPNITTHYQQQVTSLERHEQHWQVNTSDRYWQSAHVIIAAGHTCQSLLPDVELPMKAIRGQVSQLPYQGLSPKTVVCGDGYISPMVDNVLHVGATFTHDNDANTCSAQDRRENFQRLSQLMPELYELAKNTLEPDSLNNDKVGFRCSSPDYLPIVGPIPDQIPFIEHYAPLRQNGSTTFTTPPPYLPGLWITAAHGSRGLITAPLAGEILASYLAGEPIPLTTEVLQATHPCRFLIRGLKRRQI